MQDLTPEERTSIFAKVREEMSKSGVQMPARGERKSGEGKGGEAKSGEAKGEGKGGERKSGDGSAVAEGGRKGGEGGGRRGGQGGPGGAGGMGMMGMGGGQAFNQKDLDNAKLPPPPEESSQLDVLLRPGLLSDVEIIVERVPNAINIPAQAVFQKDNKFVVYVKQGNKLVARTIKPLKRSESVMIVAEGLKAGEEIAMQDPDAKPSDKKKKGSSEGSGGGGAPMMPGGGGKKG